MEGKKIKKLVRVAFVIINLNCMAVIFFLFYRLFPSLNTKLCNVYHIGGILDIILKIPVWPMMLLILTIFLCMACTKYLYRCISSKIQV